MKSIVTTDITSSAAAKIKKGTLAHINAMTKEAPVELAKSLIGANYDSTKAYILYGCEDSNASATVFDMSAGCVLYGGALYIVPAQSITVSAGQTIQFYPTPSYTSSTDADPVTFTDGSTHNIHLNDGGVWVSAATGSGVTLLDNMIKFYGTTKTAVLTYDTNVDSGTVNYYRNKAGFITLSGSVIMKTAASSSETLFTLPTNYRPSSNIRFAVTDNNIALISINISTSGVITAVSATTLSSKTIFLNNIHFYNY